MNMLSALLKRLSFSITSKTTILLVAITMSGVASAGIFWSDHDDDDFDDDKSEHHRGGKQLQILWTNDTHGFFLPVYHAEYSEIDTYAEIAAKEGMVGGYAQIAGLVKRYKRGKWNERTLFVDTGDTFDGSPVAQLTRGAAVVPILNAMGYDAWTPGNRDFAWSNGNFSAVSSQLNIPTVCANLKDTSGNPVFPAYMTKEVGGLKVAMIGLTSLAGMGSGSPGQPVEYQVVGGVALETLISNLAADIRETEKPDLVIVLSHMGFYQDQKLAANTTGIDVFVGAHTHHNVKKAPVIPNADGSRDVIVAQAGSHGKYLGKLRLMVKDGKVVNHSNKLIRVSEKTLKRMDVKPDREIAELAYQAYAPFKDMLDEVIGETSTVIERRGDTQSTMTNFLTDAISERYGVDGSRFPGIRYGSSNIPGPITVGDVWNIVSPNFGNNRMYRYRLTGGAIANSIRNGLNAEYGEDPYNWNGGDVFRYNNRVKYTFNADVNNTKHLVDLTVTKANGDIVELVKDGVNQMANFGEPFEFAGTAPLPGATNVCIAGTPPAMCVPPPVAPTAVDEIVAYIKSKGTIAPAIDDRTVQLDDAPSNVSDIN